MSDRRGRPSAPASPAHAPAGMASPLITPPRISMGQLTFARRLGRLHAGGSDRPADAGEGRPPLPLALGAAAGRRHRPPAGSPRVGSRRPTVPHPPPPSDVGSRWPTVCPPTPAVCLMCRPRALCLPLPHDTRQQAHEHDGGEYSSAGAIKAAQGGGQTRACLCSAPRPTGPCPPRPTHAGLQDPAHTRLQREPGGH